MNNTTVKCKICGNNTDIPDAVKCNRCWELVRTSDSLISDHPEIAYKFFLDKAIEVFKKLKEKTE